MEKYLAYTFLTEEKAIEFSTRIIEDKIITDQYELPKQIQNTVNITENLVDERKELLLNSLYVEINSRNTKRNNHI